MGLIATSKIYLKSEFSSYDSGKINQILKSVCTEVVETRKGRHWNAKYRSKDISLLTIDVHTTKNYFSEIEDELLELNLSTEKAPEVISIVSNTGKEIDKNNCQVITDLISSEFDCICVDAKLVS